MKIIWAAAIAAVVASAAWAAVPNPQAGKWSHSGKVISAEIPGVPSFIIKAASAPKTRSSCLTADQSANAPHMLFRVPDVTCTSRNFTMANGQISGSSTCTSKKMKTPVTVTSTGTYNATSYNVRSVTTGTYKGKPAKIVTSGSGKWVAASCK